MALPIRDENRPRLNLMERWRRSKGGACAFNKHFEESVHRTEKLFIVVSTFVYQSLLQSLRKVCTYLFDTYKFKNHSAWVKVFELCCMLVHNFPRFLYELLLESRRTHVATYQQLCVINFFSRFISRVVDWIMWTQSSRGQQGLYWGVRCVFGIEMCAVRCSPRSPRYTGVRCGGGEQNGLAVRCGAANKYRCGVVWWRKINRVIEQTKELNGVLSGDII